MHGNQQGDPVKAALILIAQSKENTPALHLFLGQDAFDSAHKKIEGTDLVDSFQLRSRAKTIKA